MSEELPDIPRLWTAAAEWGACLVYVLAAWRATDPARRAVVVLGTALPVIALYQLLAGTLPMWAWLPAMVGAVGLMWLVLHLALGGSVRRSTYLVVRAFVVAELVASLQWQLSLSTIAAPASSFALAVATMVVFDTLMLGLLLAIERRQMHSDPSPTPVDVAVSTAIAAITFALSNLSFVSTATPFSGRLGREIFYIRTLVDLCGYVVLYAQRETARQTSAARELATSRALLRSQYDQYLASKRAMDVVNRKYHDLRNLVTAIRGEEDPQVRRDQLDELEASVRPYAAFVRSGNPVLDVILTDKGQVCAEREVTLRMMADGAALAFLSPMDMAAILGNGLDNAIEAAVRVAAPEDRVIRLDIRRRRGFVVIEIENPLVGAAVSGVSRDGLFATTKEDTSQHGFGLASIRQAAARYDGEMSASPTGHGTFRLRVLLPVPESASPTSAAPPVK
ncbi:MULTISPECIES: sensor histidine kinase [Actinomyces]|uniref:Sensor histidine kinase n=1 Tax=Actinomyces respiraculi TaxID=2744574 RepID=A0A7T0PVN7_9ACTO|nr:MULTISPECIES: GHKL domain-containing protein [Actinomyces]QPL04613.1 sensor histidine kinase [Actinomyces respiraculi]